LIIYLLFYFILFYQGADGKGTALPFGHQVVHTGVEGIELLENDDGEE
jgi:hypothetical protein